MHTFSLQTLLAATSIVLVTAAPSLSGGLCNKGTTASSEQVVVANLEEGAKGDGVNLPTIETNDQSLTTSTSDHTSSE